MENMLPLSKKLLHADAFADKLFSLLFAVLLCYCPNTHAGAKPSTRYRGRHNDDGYTAEVITATKLPFFAAPTLSYSSPQTYTAGTAVTLTPTSSGVAALGFSSSPTTVGTGFAHPNAVAVDAAGNVYVADAGHNAVKKIPVAGGSPVSIGSGFSNPSGVTVDAAGNVYVADAGHNAVKKIPAGGGSTVSIGSGFSDPLGVAVDAAGNVYVADAGNHSIKMIAVGGSTFSLTFGGFDKPSGVAVDVSGTNIYIAESGIGAGIYRIALGTAGWNNFGPGFTRPAGVSVDNGGNVLVADAGTNIISKIPPNGGSSTTMGSGFKGPTGVVQDAAGNVYVADNGNNAVKKIKPIGGYFISSALPAGLSFNRSTGVISGTPTASSPAKNYVITAYNSGGSKSATVNIKVNLPPAPTISYSSPHTYTVGTAIPPLAPASSNVTAKGYSANPVVLPPGFVFPSTVAKDAAGNIYALDADNNHVLKTPPGGTQGVYATTSDRPNCVATDAAGNLFVGLFYGNQIEKIPVGGGAHTFIGSGFNPQSIAVDPVGNLFVVDGHSPDNPNGGAVEELFAGGGGTGLTGGSLQPNDIALDTLGNVYVQGGAGSEKIKPIGGYYISKTLPAGLIFNNSTGVISGTPTQSSPATVYTITAYNNFSSKSTMVNIKVNGPPNVSYSSPHNYTANVAAPPLVPTSRGVAAAAYGSPVTLPAGFVFPSIVAKDSAGNVYTLDADNNHVLKTPAGSGTPVVYATTSDRPTCITSDAAGNLFVGLYFQFHIEKIPVGGGAHVILNASFDAFGIAVDPTGNLFIADGHAPDNPFAGAVEEYFAGGGGKMLVDGSNKPNDIAVDTLGNVYVQGLAAQKLSPTGGYYISAQLPAGLSFSNATGIISGTPTVAGPAKTYTITAYNSYGSSQTRLIIKVLSKNANLASLTLTKGTLTPTFNMNTTSYTASVGNTIEAISVTPTAANPASTITVNGEMVASGSASPYVPLSVGSNAITTIVTAENGATRTYTLTVTRAAATMAIAASAPTPGDLSVKALTLYPNPNPGGQLNIMLKNYRKQENVTIYLYSMTGSKIKTLNIQTDINGNYDTVIPIASVGSPKFYVIRTVSDSGIKEGKVMVQ